MAPKAPAISLSELITNVADELRKASEGKKPQDQAVMQFKECDLELTVTFSGEGGGGFRFWLVDASAKVSASKTSKIRLKFSSIPGGPDLQYVQNAEGPAPKPVRDE